MNKESIKPPKKTLLTNSNEKLKEVLNLTISGGMSFFINLIFPSIHEKRLEKWRDSVYTALIELSELKDFSIESLKNNIEFITILKQCMLIASRNHQDEKLNFLKNIIINSIDSPLPIDYKLIFNRLVDELTPTHIEILKYTIDNNEVLKNTNKYEDYYKIIIQSNNRLNINRHEFLFFITELINRNLIIISKDVKEFELVKESIGRSSGIENENLPYIFVPDLGRYFMDYILYNK